MLNRSHRPFLLLLLGSLVATAAVQAQSLIGSKASLARQSRAARQHDYTYLRTSSQVHEFARRGLLVRLAGNSNYRVADVSFPYARPEVKTFVERLGQQYRNACGERLVVTSLTRPTTRQPRNASPLSVHPTGMALDLRRSGRPACRAFLEKTLLTLEGRGILEATRENHPPHYHVSLFPSPYKTYLASRGLSGGSASSDSDGEVALAKYRVRGGDSLWTIAKRHGTSVDRLKRANGMSSSRLKPGQVLEIPIAR
ncbi:MAG TPA: DUF5715 family protein [Thermoanaerobaculia bacterium]|nr:DUF5715 family protein [Thermoanaerobaculia bacterium]